VFCFANVRRAFYYFNYFYRSVAPELETVNLSGCILVTDKGMLTLSTKCGHVKSLGVSYVKRLTDQALCTMADYLWLEELDISGCSSVTDDGVEVLVLEFAGMVKLDLSSCECRRRHRVCLESGADLPPAPRVSKYQKWRGRLQSISTFCSHARNFCSQTPALLRPSSPPPAPRAMAAAGTKLTDEALDSIARHASNLRWLKLFALPAVTDGGVVSLRARCPKLQVVLSNEANHVDGKPKDRIHLK